MDVEAAGTAQHHRQQQYIGQSSQQQHYNQHSHGAAHHSGGYPTPGQQYSTIPSETAQQYNNNNSNNHSNGIGYANGVANSVNPMPSPAPSSSTSPQLNAASTYSPAVERAGASTNSPNLTAQRGQQGVLPPPTPSQNAGTPTFSSPQSAHLQTSQAQYDLTTQYVPTDRSLPDRSIGENPNATDEENDKAFEDAYVAFVLYCNPTFSISSTDTLDLRKNFSTPPKSDGKSFNTRVLYDLLRKLDRKELKTWTELALELGVQKPAVNQGQSAQKVQQYSVRLKRWLRASHIDAFFDHMMGKVPNYIRDIPSPSSDPFPEYRDLVCRDDDLALRALKPEFRPKRGRRRADELGEDGDPMSAIEPKRPHLDTSLSAREQQQAAASAFPTPSTGQPYSGYPQGGMTAHPDDVDGPPSKQGNWLTSSNSGGNSALPTPASAARTNTFRFHHPGQHGHLSAQPLDTPTTPHPLSSIPMTPTPLSGHPESAFPHSAIDENAPTSASPAYLSQSQKMRMRRRHGTAVSSAWPGNNTTPNGKLRGRPPSNRTVKDGQFISFPANPNASSSSPASASRKDIPALDTNVRGTPNSAIPQSGSTVDSSIGAGNSLHSASTAGADRTPIQSASTASPNIDSPFSTRQIPTPISASSMSGKPGRMSLSLQVPQHVGNPVHLVTPPTVTINGAPTPSTTASVMSGVGVGGSRDDAKLGSPAVIQTGYTIHQTPTTAGTPTSGFLHPAHVGMGAAPTSAPSPAAMSAMAASSAHNTTPSISAEALHRGLAADLVRAEMTGRRRKRLAAAVTDANDKGKGSSKGPGKKAKTAGKAASTPTSTTFGTSSAAGACLRGTEARDLAGAMIRGLRAGFGFPPLSNPATAVGGTGTPTITDASPTMNITGFALAATNDPSEATFRTFCAAYLGIPAPNTASLGQSNAQGPSASKRITVRRFRIDEHGYEDPMGDDESDEEDEEDQQPSSENTSGRRRSKTQATISTPVGNKNKKKIKETFDVEWDVNIGGLVGKFTMKGLTLDSAIGLGGIEHEVDGDVHMEDAHADGDGDNQEGESGSGLERRVKRLESMLRRKNEELRVLKEAVLDVALQT